MPRLTRYATALSTLWGPTLPRVDCADLRVHLLLLSCCIFFFSLYTNTRTPHVARERGPMCYDTCSTEGGRKVGGALWFLSAAEKPSILPGIPNCACYLAKAVPVEPGHTTTVTVQLQWQTARPRNTPWNFEDSSRACAFCPGSRWARLTGVEPGLRCARSAVCLPLCAAPADQRCVNPYFWLEGKRDTGALTSDVTASPTFPLLFKQTRRNERAGLPQSRGSTNNYPASTVQTPSLLAKLFV